MTDSVVQAIIINPGLESRQRKRRANTPLSIVAMAGGAVLCMQIAAIGRRIGLLLCQRRTGCNKQQKYKYSEAQ